MERQRKPIKGMDDKRREEILNNALVAYTHANNMPMDISKRSWLEYLRGKSEDEKILHYIDTQVLLMKRVVDSIIGEDSKLSAKSSIFTADLSELKKELLHKV